MIKAIIIYLLLVVSAPAAEYYLFWNMRDYRNLRADCIKHRPFKGEYIERVTIKRDKNKRPKEIAVNTYCHSVKMN